MVIIFKTIKRALLTHQILYHVVWIQLVPHLILLLTLSYRYYIALTRNLLPVSLLTHCTLCAAPKPHCRAHGRTNTAPNIALGFWSESHTLCLLRSASHEVSAGND